MADGPDSRESLFEGALDFFLFLVGTLTALLFAYILYLMGAAAIRGESGDVSALFGLALWGGLSALAWIARSALRSRHRGETDG